MAINVKLVSNNINKVTYTQNSGSIVIKNDAFAAASKLANLTDVSLANTANGNILIYNKALSEFVLDTPDDLIFKSMDGGTF